MENFKVRLVDVSKYQDDYSTTYVPTFKKIIEEGFMGVMIRVGYGLVEDRMHKIFVDSAKSFEFPYGGYWYLDYYSHKGTGISDEDWGIEQANVCYNILKSDFGGMPLIVDCEVYNPFPISYFSRPSYNKILKSFIKEWKRLTGKVCGIYCSPGFFDIFDLEIKGMDLWMALYNRGITSTQAISYGRSKGWTGRILIWQYTNDGDTNNDGVPDGLRLGMETNSLDLNGWLGTVEEWSKYCGEALIPVDPSPVIPPSPSIGNKFIVVSLDGINVRDVPIRMPGSQIIGYYPKGTILTSLETVTVDSDIWIRISPWSVCALKYNGVIYLKEIDGR